MSHTQRDRLAELFTNHPNQWIPLPWILNMGIAQYNARIWELRRQGLKISNKWEMVDGVKKSCFCYIPEEECQELDSMSLLK